MIEAARRGRDKNGMLQCAMVSQLGHSLNVVTSSSRWSSNQPVSFLKLRRDMLYAWQKRTAPWGEEVEVASAIRVLCVLKRAYKTGIAALSVAILCTLHSLCAWYGQFIKLGPGFFVRILLCFALLPIVHGRWKLWFRHAICHNSFSKTILLGSL